MKAARKYRQMALPFCDFGLLGPWKSLHFVFPLCTLRHFYWATAASCLAVMHASCASFKSYLEFLLMTSHRDMVGRPKRETMCVCKDYIRLSAYRSQTSSCWGPNCVLADGDNQNENIANVNIGYGLAGCGGHAGYVQLATIALSSLQLQAQSTKSHLQKKKKRIPHFVVCKITGPSWQKF